MRRTAKPFTIELKKRGHLRKRDAADITPINEASTSVVDTSFVGRDMRFREAENLFRGIDPKFAEQVVADSASQVFAAPTETTPPSSMSPPSSMTAPQRRILRDLVAEAALSDASIDVMPQPRRRGRPPKSGASVLPRPVKDSRKKAVDVRAAFSLEDYVEPSEAKAAAAVEPAHLFIAASERRRAARRTDNLPRGERWKRRLPKVCW